MATFEKVCEGDKGGRQINKPVYLGFQAFTNKTKKTQRRLKVQTGKFKTVYLNFFVKWG